MSHKPTYAFKVRVKDRLIVKLSFDPVCPSVVWFVGWFVHPFVCNNFLKGEKFHFHALVRALFYNVYTFTFTHADRQECINVGVCTTLGYLLESGPCTIIISSITQQPA